MIKCEDVCVLEENFLRNIEENVIEGEIPVRLEKNFAPNLDPNVCNAKLELFMEIGSIKIAKHPFYYKIRIAGIFSWENMSVEVAEKEVSSDGGEILYSFIRTYFYETLKKANLNTVVLPSINN